jgi:serine phosphatase RsbU (regulator of sigma subunit)/CHASE2 domain-containing sensor protein
MKRFRSLPALPRYALGVFAAGLVLFGLEALAWFEKPEFLARDWRFRTRETLDPWHRFDPRIKVAGITEADLAAVGRWPWSRGYHGELVSLLAAAGADAVSFDLLFTEPGGDREADASFANAAGESGGIVIAGAQQVRLQGVASGDPGPPLHSARPAPSHPDDEKDLVVLSPYLELAAAVRTGFVNADADPDGGRRELPLVIAHQGRWYPGLALGSLMTYWDLDVSKVEVVPGRHVRLATPEGDRLVPIDEEGRYVVNLRSPDRFLAEGVVSYVRLYQALSQHLVEGAPWDAGAGLHPAGRLFLVGQVAPGLSDMGPTAFSPLTPLCYLQAQTIDNILRQDYLKFVPAWMMIAGWTLIVTALLLAARGSSPMRTLLIASAAIAFYLIAAHMLFAAVDLLLPIVWPIAGYAAIQSGSVLRNWQVVRDSKIAVDASIRAAGEIQLATLPPVEDFNRAHPSIDLAAVLCPAQEASGDFYDFFALDADHLCFVVADVCDKGITAATFMLQAKTLLKAEARAAGGAASPEIVLARANDALAETNRKSMFATVVLGIYEVSTGSFIYANAGHFPPLRLSAGAPPEELEGARNLALGLMPGMSYRCLQTRLEPGDFLLLYTDGVTEALDRKGRQFGSERLLDSISGTTADTLVTSHEVLASLSLAISRFTTGAAPSDDITALLFRRSL